MNQAQQVYYNNTGYLQEQLQKQKAFHAQNLEAYKSARETYLKKVRKKGEGEGRGRGS